MRISDWSSDVCSSYLDIVVDRGAGDDLAELQILVFIIEGREVQLERAVAEGVLRPNFERIDLFGPEAFGHFEDRLQRWVDAARFIAARIGGIDQIVVGDLEVDDRAAGQLVALEDRKSTRLNSSH